MRIKIAAGALIGLAQSIEVETAKGKTALRQQICLYLQLITAF